MENSHLVIFDEIPWAIVYTITINFHGGTFYLKI